MLISSRSNERVKEARSLRESKFRRATGLHFIEGDKLVGEALTSGAEVTTVFCREGTPAPRGGFELLEVTEGVLTDIPSARTPEAARARRFGRETRGSSRL